MHLRSPFPWIACAALVVAGCGSATIGGKKGFSTANDDLRRRVAELEDEKRLVAAQRDELAAKLAEESRVRQGLVGADVLAAIPRCAGVDLDSLSGFDPLDPAEPLKGFVAYVEPYDGQRRFVQIVGTLRAQVVELSMKADSSEPHTLASVTLTPSQLREAYRAGLGGTHYEVHLPLAQAASTELRGKPLLLRLQFEDALTGEIREASMNLGEHHDSSAAR